MKKTLSLLALVLLVVSVSACTKKQEAVEAPSEPVEGSSSAANEKAGENPPDEMQEKKKDDGAAAPAKAD